jgi:hypothetical protein
MEDIVEFDCRPFVQYSDHHSTKMNLIPNLHSLMSMDQVMYICMLHRFLRINDFWELTIFEN